ncbi:hypothetical protein FDUTEX481_02412 [Tolypothrix sp. PCC 7601]|nr:hypothetical protein FDUTEX481_02412 [Tolypothrix sp. PCC 7601]
MANTAPSLMPTLGHKDFRENSADKYMMGKTSNAKIIILHV